MTQRNKLGKPFGPPPERGPQPQGMKKGGFDPEGGGYDYKRAKEQPEKWTKKWPGNGRGMIRKCPENWPAKTRLFSGSVYNSIFRKKNNLFLRRECEHVLMNVMPSN